MKLKRVLIGSPVCQKPDILKEYLASIINLSHKGFEIDYAFVDGNQDRVSSQMLIDFRREGSMVTIFPASDPGGYLCDEDTHHWNNSLMLRAAEWKNRIIRYALKKEYDHLFLTDSDLVLKPELLEHLLETGKDVISEIFWTRWQPGQPLEPNVWLFDEYDMARRNPGEEISA